MLAQKLYAGVTLRETRVKHGLTQKDFATKLGVSLPYLNQMENNHRPVSATVVLALAHEFGFDVTQLSVGESDRIVADMREALADPVFSEAQTPLADMQLTASNAPALARAFLELPTTARRLTVAAPAAFVLAGASTRRARASRARASRRPRRGGAPRSSS